METLLRRSLTTLAIQNSHDRPDRPDRTQFGNYEEELPKKPVGRLSINFSRYFYLCFFLLAVFKILGQPCRCFGVLSLASSPFFIVCSGLRVLVD